MKAQVLGAIQEAPAAFLLLETGDLGAQIQANATQLGATVGVCIPTRFQDLTHRLRHVQGNSWALATLRIQVAKETTR